MTSRERRESSGWTLGSSFNAGQQRSLIEALAEQGSSEPSPSSSESIFISKLPSAVANVSDKDKKSYVHTKRVTNYLIGTTLGEGSFAKVKEGFHLLVGEKVAIKIIDKKKAQQDSYVNKNFRREAKLLQMVHHPNILQLLEVVETDNSYYLITELCSGGELMKHIYAKNQLSEEETRKYMRQMVSAVNHLHQAGIIHRDLKVENLLLDDGGNVKIIDFGLSNEEFTVEEGQRIHCTTQCGSPAYAAPELLGHKSYGPEVDIWSLGVNMYAMLTGCLPYTVEPFNITALHAKMLENKMNPIPSSLSPECIDLLHGLLTSDPDKRIKMADIMTHPWITRESPLKAHPYPNKLTANDVNEDIIDHMVHALQQRQTVELLTAELLTDRACAVSAVYYLLQARLSRYNKRHTVSKIGRKSRYEAHISRKEDDTQSTISHLARGRENGTQLRPVTRQPQSSAEGKSRLRERRNTLPPELMQAEIDKMKKTLPPVQKKTGTLPRSLRKRPDHTLLSHRADPTSVQRPVTQLNPVRPPPVFPTSISHPKDLNKLRHDVNYHAWASQPPSQASLTGSRQRYPSNPPSRQPSATSTRSTTKNNRRSCPEYDDLEFHEVDSISSSSRYNTSHGTRKVSTGNGYVHFPSLTNQTGRGSHQWSCSHDQKEQIPQVKRTNGHWSPCRQYEFNCDKPTKAVVNELSRLAETLHITYSGVKGNTVYLRSHSTKFQVHVDNDSTYGVCKLEFQWLQGGSQDTYKSLCADILQSLSV